MAYLQKQHWCQPTAPDRQRFNSHKPWRSAAPTTSVATTAATRSVTTKAKVVDNRVSPLEMFSKDVGQLGPSVRILARCDRCGQVLLVPVPQEWLRKLEKNESRFPLPSGHPPRSCDEFLRDIHFRTSPQICPGSGDGSCLAKRTLDKETWLETKALPETSYEVNQEWLQLGLPSAAGFLTALGWQEKLQSAVARTSKNDPRSLLSNTWIIYLHWRCAWNFFSLRKGGMRHESAKLERMWGQVDVDIMLLEYGMLEKADLEALYCTNYSTLAGLISCGWLYALAVLNMFFGIRRDIGKDHFNQLKMAVQRADTAMGKYLSACVNMTDSERDFRRQAAFTAYRHVEEHLIYHASAPQLRELYELRQWPSLPSAELLEVFLTE